MKLIKELEYILIYENPDKGKYSPVVPEPNILIVRKKDCDENRT